MSCIYLIRHGRPQTPDNRTYCLGRDSDPHLSADGQRQSKVLSECFEGLKFNKVYYSPLKRSRETAELLSAGKWLTCEDTGINEIGVGLWEGLSFDEIRSKYPDIYSARGEDWALSPPGGEGLDEAAERMEKAIKRIAYEEATYGGGNDLLAVTHDGVIRALLWRLMGLDTKKDVMIRQPYGSITVLKYADGQLSATALGKLPEDSPADEEIEELWELCNTSSDVRDHCYAVCEEALEIREQLKAAGLFLSHEHLLAASLLHDLCRHDGKEHPVHAARMLRERGYLKVARIMELHHKGDFNEGISEAGVLYLADKRIEGIRKVSIQERFEISLRKCTSEEAKLQHAAQYQAALYI
ncbi:MAG TPA: histidine phosphatase family protein, partial [Negativicutes bacterium]|nr:histidine phosphatase family protein [Negativicutes bacterium]